MKALPFAMIRRNVKSLLGYMSIFAALAMLSVTIIRPTAASGAKNHAVHTPEVTIPADAPSLGAVPDGPGGAGLCGANRDVTFTVAGMGAPLTNVEVSLTMTHTWVGDVDASLRSPGGTALHLLFSRTGATTATSFGDDSDLIGPYNFKDSAAGTHWWTAAATATAAQSVAAGDYRTVATGPSASPPAQTTITTTFAGLTTGQVNGTWTLRVRDCSSGDTGTVTAANLTITGGAPSVAQKPPLDFDGDGKTDYAVTRDVTGTFNWYVQRSTAGFLGQSWGASATDKVVPGDYDGDLKWDFAVWRPGTPAIFYILKSSTGTLQIVAFGQTGDEPRITQDFDGDGKADPAVTRDVGGILTWYILRSTLGFTAVPFGNSTTDVSIRGDYDGDGKADVAVYRNGGGSPANTFYVQRSSDGGVQGQTFGVFSTDYVLPADFDGDGKTDYAVWRGASTGTPGTWYWLQSSDGGFRSLNFGIGGIDRPVPGDYDGDGKSDQAVWRHLPPSTFYVNRSSLGFIGFGFGVDTDTPPAFILQVR